jgi:predicted RecA/RadA family phage recombinase
MKNYIQPGNIITVTAPAGGVTSGAGLLVGNLFGIATADATAGADVEIATTGVFDLPKAVNATFTEGQRVSWDAANAQTAAPATGMIPVGLATEAAANGTTTARVRLDGVSTDVAA